MQKKVAWLSIALAVTLVVGCRGPKADTNQEAARAPVAVATVPATTRPMSKDLVVNGTLIAKSQVNVMPKTSGRILELRVEEGSRVRKGETIAVLETPELGWQLQQQKSALISAEANRDQAEDNLSRMRELATEGVISQQQLKAAETQAKVASSQVKQAKAAISLMESQLANATITSPISGVVIAKGLDVGAMAGPSTSIVTVAQAGSLQAKLPVAERDLGLVREGGRVTVTSVALPGEAFVGRISEIAPMVDPQTRLITVKVDLAQTGRLKVGMNVNGTVAGPTQNVLAVPGTAILTDGAEQIVYLATGGKAERVVVTTGLRSGELVEVTSGLQPGAPVITEGAAFVKNGDPIAVGGGVQ